MKTIAIASLANEPMPRKLPGTGIALFMLVNELWPKPDFGS